MFAPHYANVNLFPPLFPTYFNYLFKSMKIYATVSFSQTGVNEYIGILGRLRAGKTHLGNLQVHNNILKFCSLGADRM